MTPRLPAPPGAAEWQAGDWQGALVTIARHMLHHPDQADLLEGLLLITRRRWRASRAGRAPQLAILAPPVSRHQSSAGGDLISYPQGIDPESILSHPCDRLLIARAFPGGDQAAALWALFWGAEVQWENAPPASPRAEGLGGLWPDATAEAAFRASGGWHRLAGLAPPATAPIRAVSRRPEVLVWSQLKSRDPLPRLPDPAHPEARYLLLSEEPLWAPAPWRMRRLPPGFDSDPRQVLPPHDLALFLAPGAELPPENPAGLALKAKAAARPQPARRGFARQIRPGDPAPMVDVTLLTPTGDRLAAFARCAWLVQSQTLRPKEWLIVDDGTLPVSEVVPLPDYARVIRRPRRPDDPPHTLSANLGAALPEIRTDRVVIFEDDDWYAPDYLERLLPALDDAGMAGLNHIHYYHLRSHAWKTGTPPAHTALAQTAFRMRDAGKVLAELCAAPPEEVRRFGVIDRHWWHGFTGPKRLIRDHAQLHLGLKGGFGRAGLASGHDAAEPDYIADPQGARLIEMLGPDIAFYDRLRRPSAGPEEILVYSAVNEGQSPPVPPPASLAPYDPVLLSHDPTLVAPGWRVLPLDERCTEPCRDARKAAVLAHLYFPDRETSLWIDPDLPLVDDPAPLLARFLSTPDLLLSAPLSQGAFDPRLLLRRHNDPRLMRAMLSWWKSGAEPATLPAALAAMGLPAMSFQA